MRKTNIFENMENDIMNADINENEKSKLLKNVMRLKDNKINIMITGATGCGKSSTINALFDTEVAKVGVGVDPETMEIEKYELNTDLQKAMLLYKYKGQTVKYTMYMNNADSSFGEKKTDELVDEFLIISDNGVEIKVKEYEEKDKKVRRYEAEFEYAGAQYEIKGVVEKKEFEKILKNLYFSK